MKLKLTAALAVTLVAASFLTLRFGTPHSPSSTQTPANKVHGISDTTSVTKPEITGPNLNIFVKDVGEAYMENFGLKEEDFRLLMEAKVQIIEGNFDICAKEDDVAFFLNQAQKYNLKVVMPAGSGEAEWGYVCDQADYPVTQAPVFQKEAVQSWIKRWKDSPAIYAWDTSNEAGSVMPNASRFYLTASQLKAAYNAVKEVDTRPVMIRMNGWVFYEHENAPFSRENPFAKDIADIVQVNAYSNVDEYFPDFVFDVLTTAKKHLKTRDADIRIFTALGVWSEEPLWKRPSVEHLAHDIDNVRKVEGIESYGFFKYGAGGSAWYLPDTHIGAPHLWKFLQNLQK